VFFSPHGDQPAPASGDRVPAAARVASEYVLAAVFAAGVTHPWWAAGLYEPDRDPERGQRPAPEV
jgi:hypothetical protein